MDMTYIYTLSDENGVVRYVGKTNTLRKRLHDHIKESITSHLPSHKKNWIKSLLVKGKKPVIEILDEVPVFDWPFWEQYWMCQIRCWGFELTNQTVGGKGGNGYEHTKESKDKMRKAKLGLSQSKEHREKISKGVKDKFKEMPNYNKCYNKKVIIDKELLYRKYIVENLSLNKCAELFNVSTHSIFNNIKENGFNKTIDDWRHQLSTVDKLHINQYDLKGNFIKKWIGAVTIQNEVGYDSSVILNCCKGMSNKSYGYIWRFDGDEVMRKVNTSKKKIEVIQLKDDVVINTFNSINQASKSTNIQRSSIAYCCKGILSTAGGFIWKYGNNI